MDFTVPEMLLGLEHHIEHIEVVLKPDTQIFLTTPMDNSINLTVFQHGSTGL